MLQQKGELLNKHKKRNKTIESMLRSKAKRPVRTSIRIKVRFK